jgi:hypothetical protein
MNIKINQRINGDNTNDFNSYIDGVYVDSCVLTKIINGIIKVPSY